jgi:hypothetical protein
VPGLTDGKDVSNGNGHAERSPGHILTFDYCCRSPLASLSYRSEAACLLNDVSPQILVNAEADLIRQPGRRICASLGRPA